tara:strand:+ start:3076 stop:4158 length:1083 start_codon:yes stop_codon:yes gene_type:complete
MNVIASILVLGLLIFFHETGHFLAAISQGIRVNGFSIGFGPSIIEKEIKGVTYSLRALPLGGFVSFPGEDDLSEIKKNDPDLLRNRPIHQKIIVISAGVIANLLLSWIVLFGQASLIGLPNQPDPGVLVTGVQKNEVANSAGILSGDQILKIQDSIIGSGQDGIQSFVRGIQNSPNKQIKIEIMRAEKILTLSLTPSDKNGVGRIGAELQPNINFDIRRAKNPREIINYANNQFSDLLKRTIQGYQGLITDFSSTSKQLSGPVKIVEIGAHLSEQGGSGLIFFAALVSINLAVLNSLPLPLLDGGQLVLILIEGIRGQPIPEKIQLAFMQSGFLLLIGLSIVLIIKDTSQLSLVQQLISH